MRLNDDSANANGDELRTRAERLRALQSAWGVLAPSGLSGEKRAIAETGRALGESLTALRSDARSSGDPAVIADLDARLDELERQMREVALGVPVTQLRSTLPERLAIDRRGVLDLLDLVLSAEVAQLDDTSARIPTLDYLITLLCTGGDPDARLQDPVMLTPRLHGLCQRSDLENDPRLAEIEAEFFAAADLHQSDVREEIELRALRNRKIELGKAFFAPRVLRAIMAYNAALLQRIDEEVLSSRDWGTPPLQASEAASDSDTSVFETSALPKLGEALRRRVAGDPPANDAVDRIAWCLDLPCLTRPEHRALLSESMGRPEALEGTVILVGLLRRSAVVLEQELPAIGIASGPLSGAWLQELNEALQEEVNRRITGDDYDGACALSDLKSKFLAGGKATGQGNSQIRRPVPARAPIRNDVGGDARKQARRVPNKARESKPEKPASGLRALPWGRLGRAGAGGLLVLAALAGLNTVFWSEGRVARAELAEVSAFLSDGKRSGEGIGPGFVGSLDDDWSELDAVEQSEAADALVQALRERGISQIMVYDDDDRLRIQALGSQAPRVIP